MTQVYFHCSNSREVRIDRSGEAVSDHAEARDRAAGNVHSGGAARRPDAEQKAAQRRHNEREQQGTSVDVHFIQTRNVGGGHGQKDDDANEERRSAKGPCGCREPSPGPGQRLR